MRILTTSSVILASAVSTAPVAYAQTASKAEQREAINEASIRQANQTAKAKEAQIASQLRGIEALMISEQKLLERRLTYAAQLRQKGLKDENPQLLRKAEEVERQSVALYQQRIGKFEKANAKSSSKGAATRTQTRVNTGVVAQPVAVPVAAQPVAAPVAAQPKTQTKKSGGQSSSSASSTRRSWWPFGR